MPRYRRLAWSFYPRILVLGMGRFQAAVAFLALVANLFDQLTVRLGIHMQVFETRAVPGPAGASFDVGARCKLQG